MYLGESASRDRISITWQRANELPLSEDSDIYENDLILKNVQKQDQGVYNCIGIEPSGQIVFNRPIILKVVGKYTLFF